MQFKRRKATDDNEPSVKNARASRRKHGKKLMKERRAKEAKIAKRSKERFILMIGDDGAILVFLQGNKVVRRLFASSSEPEQVRTFQELMDAHPKATVTVLVDLMDQSYTRHTLPPVSSLSVNKLVQRRLERDFKPEDIKSFIKLGREKEGRKDWNFLLITLANPAVLQQWLDLVLEKENPFGGIYLVPIEAQDYIPQISKEIGAKYENKPQWQLLVSHHKVGGFRQVVLRDGKLVFTRLTQAMGEMPEVIAGNIEQEVLNTIEYLRRMAFNEEAGLEVIVVTAQEVNDAIETFKFGASGVHLLTPHDVSRMLGLEQAALSADRFGDVVFAASFATARRHRLRFESAYSAKLGKLKLAQTGMRTAAALLVLGMVGLSGWSLLQMFRLSSESSDLKRKSSTIQSELTATQSKLNELGDDVNRITDIVAVYDAVKPDQFDLLKFVTTLSSLTAEDATVKKLEWIRAPGAVPTATTAGTPDAAAAGAAPAPIAIPTLGDQIVLGQPEYEHSLIEMELRIPKESDAGVNRDAFVKRATELVEKAKTQFADYNVQFDQLAGTVATTENVQVTIENTASDQTIAETESVVSLTVIGPKAVGDANAVTPAAGDMGGMP